MDLLISVKEYKSFMYMLLFFMGVAYFVFTVPYSLKNREHRYISIDSVLVCVFVGVVVFKILLMMVSMSSTYNVLYSTKFIYLTTFAMLLVYLTYYITCLLYILTVDRKIK